MRDEGIVVLELIKSIWKILFNSFKLQSCQLINRLSGTQQVLMNFIFPFMMCNILLFIKPPEGGRDVEIQGGAFTVPRGLLHLSLIGLLVFTITNVSPLTVMSCCLPHMWEVLVEGTLPSLQLVCLYRGGPSPTFL